MLESGSWGHSVLQTPALVFVVSGYVTCICHWHLSLSVQPNGVDHFYSFCEIFLKLYRNDQQE